MIMDLVSVVIPCYNHEKYIRSCLESIINQTYKNIEILVCDDNSSDSSYEILKEYETILKNRFSRVIICKNEVNLGVCKTLNKLIRQCEGQYIKTIASDDMLRASAIKDYVDFMLHNNCDILFANLYIVGENVGYPVTDEEQLRKYYVSPPRISSNLTQQLCSGNFISGASQFFKRSTFDKFGYYDERFCLEDWEFSLRVSKSGKIKYLDKVTMYYRMMEGTLSHYGSDPNSILKHRRFYHDKLTIFKEYNAFCNKQSKIDFFSHAVIETIILNDKELLKEICQEINNSRIRIRFGAKFRLLLFQFGMYGIIRFVKNYLKSNILCDSCREDRRCK